MNKGSDTNAPQVVQHEGTCTDSMLAKRIWDRYGTSPGVIQRDRVLQRANYAAQFGVSRFPLLADIQQRWALRDTPLSYAWKAMPYVPWSASATEAGTASPHTPPNEIQHMSRAHAVSPPRPVIQHAVRSKVGQPKPMLKAKYQAADRSTEMRQLSASSSAQVKHSAVEGAIIVPAAITTHPSDVHRPLLESARRSVQDKKVDSVATTLVTTTSSAIPPRDLGRAVVHRRESASAGDLILARTDHEKNDDQSNVSSPLTKGSPPAVHPSDLSSRADSPKAREHIISSASTTPGTQGMVMFQRRLPEPAMSSSVGSGATILQSNPSISITKTVQKRPPTEEARAKGSTGISSGVIAGNPKPKVALWPVTLWSVEPIILQHRQRCTVNQALHDKPGYPPLAPGTPTPVLTNTNGLRREPAVHGQTSASAPSSLTQHMGLEPLTKGSPPAGSATKHAAIVAESGDMVASIVRRYQTSPFAWLMRASLATAGEQHFFSSANTLMPHLRAEIGQETLPSHAVLPDANNMSTLKAVSLNPRGHQRPDAWGSAYHEVPWVKSVETSAGATPPTVQGFGVDSPMIGLEMPLARMVNFHDAGAGRERTPWDHHQRLTSFDGPPAELQRASAGESDQTPTGRSPGTASPQNIGAPIPFLSGVKQPGPEMPDLEQLVDRIYTIIERRLIIRLTIEKENRGL